MKAVNAERQERRKRDWKRKREREHFFVATKTTVATCRQTPSAATFHCHLCFSFVSLSVCPFFLLVFFQLQFMPYLFASELYVCMYVYIFFAGFSRNWSRNDNEIFATAAFFSTRVWDFKIWVTKALSACYSCSSSCGCFVFLLLLFISLRLLLHFLQMSTV